VSVEVQARPELRDVRGPTAFRGELSRLVALTVALAVMEFKVRYFGSALGYLWQLVRPLMLFGILYVVFTQFVHFNAGVNHFPAVLLTSIVLYTFFADATVSSLASLLDRENLVRKIQFPRVVVPLAAVLTSTFNLLTNLVAVAVFVVATGVRPTHTWLGMPLVLFVLVAFAVGCSLVLSALYVRFRDVQPIWEVFLQLLFYASPVLYAIEVLPSRTVQEGIMCNPVATLLQQSRHWLIDPSAPSAAAAIGGTARLAVPIGIAMVIGLLGIWVFRREAPGIAERL
jgi:ABC-2 type transport system permease protein